MSTDTEDNMVRVTRETCTWLSGSTARKIREGFLEEVMYRYE